MVQTVLVRDMFTKQNIPELLEDFEAPNHEAVAEQLFQPLLFIGHGFDFPTYSKKWSGRFGPVTRRDIEQRVKPFGCVSEIFVFDSTSL